MSRDRQGRIKTAFWEFLIQALGLVVHLLMNECLKESFLGYEDHRCIRCILKHIR